ncbi:MAG: glutathione S-transferase family protein [Rhodospirillales bacterium]|nr:MAG: glutathione S-transferase family protein [Rhodospirillales bacterium]
MAELILHNYDFSNYAEKARIALGYKALTWRSVVIPPIAPKPDLTPLTGGYRRTPVLQIGADVYCDTRLILRELDRRHPDPPLFPPELEGVANAITYWVENQFFRPVALHVSGVNADLMPEGLFVDRSRMRGLPDPDLATVRRAAARNAPLVRAQLPLIENMLADGRRWVCGDRFTSADIAVYHTLWFFGARSERVVPLLAPYAALRAWMERVAAFGHGQPSPMTAAEALRAAADAAPAPAGRSAPDPDDPPVGARVRIRADDYARDPVDGTLDFIDDREIAIRREDPVVGEIVVHFPRLGYDLRAA